GKYYGEKYVFEGLDITVERGEKVALVGRNVEGKSTFSKIAVGEITDYRGLFELGHAVKIGYFAQNQAALLDGNKTVFETIDEIAVGEVRTRIRNILGCFLFSGEDTEKKVKVLSGGEKTRLAIAKLLLEPVNLLILDEPTNHLDMRSKDILKNALLQYDGTLVVVSHDRDFLEGLTTKVYEFRNGRVRLHLGDVNDFLADRKIERLQELERSEPGKAAMAKAAQPNMGKQPAGKAQPEMPAPVHKAGSAQEREQQKRNERELRKIRNAIEKLEAEITALEAELAEMDKVFIADAAQCTVENCRIYEEKKNSAAQKTDEWAALQEKLTSLS
ncbi:MAG: ATP-binding cassette domain-containing protein, partial [Bacteroidales bacterium]|nr:ATP-binding cassette domain-containing protein [Bacteroidales bacterium]